MIDKKISISIEKKSLIIGVILILFGIMAPLLVNVHNFNIYELLYGSLRNYDKGLLMLAAFRLVLLNSIRGLPHYLGTFIIAESTDITIKGEDVPHIKGIIALIIIPLVYSIINSIHNIKYDLGVPAFIVIFAIMYLEKMDYSKISFIKKSFIIILLLLGGQWLDVIPQLSLLRLGRGETSQDIKAIASIIDGNGVLDTFASMLFAIFTFNALLVTRLINDENKILLTTEENKRVEKELNEAKMKALQARNYIELKNLVHDLKTPLTSTQALVSVLGLMEEDTKKQTYLLRIESSIDKMSDMISEILYEEKKNVISTEELFNYIFSHISPLPFSLRVIYNNEAKDSYIRVNKIRFSRAIINALDNSYKALNSDSGNIYVNVYSNTAKVYIIIKDDGIGIEEELIKNIREEGYSRSGSTGLGLNFIDDVIKSHEGRMYLTSKYGEGTSLKITLPKEIINE